MLKRIHIQHLTLGMYLHEFCGSWMDHPFWRAKFLLKDPGDLARIQATAIQEIWIDTDKGLDVAAGTASVSREVTLCGQRVPFGTDLIFKARDDFMEQDALWYLLEAAPTYKYMIDASSTVMLNEQQFSSAWRGYTDIWFAHVPSGEEYRAGYFRTM